mmetsp:Transcript_25809/g.53669  ORF Transcript_25809/g.53669 Transcript_25809/m.53669 type:complete len:432 (-) Transcript_25809:12-1307(-)
MSYKNTKPNGTTLLSSSSASSLCRLPVVALASCLLLAWTGEGCMIQGTDSGFCDYRYHPMYYSKTPNDPYAWLSEPKGDWQSYVAESMKMWANGTEPGQFGSCQTGSDGHCLSYCGKYLFGFKPKESDTFPASHNYYVPCVPRDQSLPKDRNFPQGRFQAHTVREKDRWIHDFVNEYIFNPVYGRIKVEKSEKDDDEEVDEYLRPDRDTEIRFSEPTGRCKDAYMAYQCWINFPRCDVNTNESLPMCRSACENMMEICGYPEHMWRCGDARYFNSQDGWDFDSQSGGSPEMGYTDEANPNYKPGDPKNKLGKRQNGFQIAKWKEEHNWYMQWDDTDQKMVEVEGDPLPADTSTLRIDSTYIEGSNTLRRDFFPGQPFKSIECHKTIDNICDHKPVCTPSFPGSSPGLMETRPWILALTSIAAVGLVVELLF